MITYEAITTKPELANSLIGMSLEEFDELFAAFELAQIQGESLYSTPCGTGRSDGGLWVPDESTSMPCMIGCS